MKINEKKAPIHFTQTSLASHEAWAALTMKSQRASQLMHLFVANVGDENAVVASQKNLARLMGVKSVNTVKAAIKILIDGNWIQVVRLGERGGVNAYVLNSSVAWSEKRENIRYAKFTAEVIVSSDEQVQPLLSNEKNYTNSHSSMNGNYQLARDFHRLQNLLCPD